MIPTHERSRPGTTPNGSSAQMVTTTPSAAEVTAAIDVLARSLSRGQWLTVGAFFGLRGSS